MHVGIHLIIYSRQSEKAFGSFALHRCLHSPHQGVSQDGGIVKDARRHLLAGHFGQLCRHHLQSITLQVAYVECRTEPLPHGRQLGTIAHQQQLAALRPIHILDEVVKQIPCAEGRTLVERRDHRRLIADKEHACPPVLCQFEALHLDIEPVLSIDRLVDRERRMSGHRGKDLRGAPRRSHQLHGHLRLVEHLHQCTHKRRLSGARIALQNENPITSGTAENELSEQVHRLFLQFIGRKLQFFGHFLPKKGKYHTFFEFFRYKDIQN